MAQNRGKRRKQAKQKKKGPKASKQNVPEHLKAQLSQALHLHQTGQIGQAIPLYRQILDAQPSYADANHLLGVALHQSGELEEAIGLIKKAIKSTPGRPAFHSNLGNALKAMDRRDEAVACYRKALLIDPEFVSAHVNLGNALNDLGRYDEAAVHLRKAIRLQPDSPEAHNNLGLTLHEGENKPDEAIACFNKALSLRSNYAEAHGNLGNVFKEQGQWTDAIDCYERALEIDPDFHKILLNLGLEFLREGRVEEAFSSLRKAISLQPQEGQYWSAWAGALDKYPFSSIDETLFDDLYRLLDQATVRPRQLVGPVLRALSHNPEYSEIQKLAHEEDSEQPVDYAAAAEKLSAIPLLVKLMGLCHFDDLSAERMLTSLRRAMITQLPEDNVQKDGLPFSAALALHCYVNEYVFDETEEEKAAVGNLEAKVVSYLEQDRDIPAIWVAALGAYRPLFGFPWAEKLQQGEWPDVLQEVITRQVAEPDEEKELRSNIPALGAITDSVSRAVRDQYEANPYPRWVKTGVREKALPIGKIMREIQLPVSLADCEFPDKPEILIAGCGTGQQSIIAASRYANSRVTAVDLSLASLGYAARKSRELGVSNIKYAQGDILELAGLDKQFDIIECGGVLHHMDDPMAGWRVLVDRLRPGGLMMIALYSDLARSSVVKARSMIAEKEYPSTAEGIRNCRREIIKMSKNGDADAANITTFTDFYSLSECRDLLFHVQEHRFTIPKIEAAIADIELEFLGFEIADQAILRKFQNTYSQGDARVSLSSWHEFELSNPDTFTAMYQFWCQKKI